MSAEAVREAVAALRAAYDAVAAEPVDALTKADVLSAMDELESLANQLPTQWRRLLARLQCETTPKALGGKSWHAVLRERWRLSTGEASRRLAECADLGPRQGLTGEPLEPLLPAVAAAQAAGAISGEHVKVLRETMRDVPAFVDVATKAQIEVDLVRVAIGVGPKELTETAGLRLFMLDQDGREPDESERQRKRGAKMSAQDRDGMSTLTVHMTPDERAVWEVIFARYAVPGMCNPADEEPCTSGTPTQAQIDNDDRSLDKRQLDAMIAVGRIALISGELGQLNGLPVTVIIRTTLQDLESQAGIGTTGGGTIIPIKDVVKMAAHANHHLAVFDGATGSALDLFRARRTASPAQRIMLVARDGGCTKPGCTVGAYGCQAHHMTDWSRGGFTNVDDMALACGVDNRMVEEGGLTTRMNARHEAEWIPPPDLDTGQHRINFYHRPELLLRPLDEYAPAPADKSDDAPRVGEARDESAQAAGDSNTVDDMPAAHTAESDSRTHTDDVGAEPILPPDDSSETDDAPNAPDAPIESYEADLRQPPGQPQSNDGIATDTDTACDEPPLHYDETPEDGDGSGVPDGDHNAGSSAHQPDHEPGGPEPPQRKWA